MYVQKKCKSLLSNVCTPPPRLIPFHSLKQAKPFSLPTKKKKKKKKIHPQPPQLIPKIVPLLFPLIASQQLDQQPIFQSILSKEIYEKPP